jgi:hypothetical protein
VWTICCSDNTSIQEAAADAAGAVEALIELAISQQSGGGTSAAGGSSSAAQQPAVCAVCHKPGCRHKRLRLCGACRAVRYCSVCCQRLHWPEHYRECAGMAQQGASSSSG